MLAEVPPPWRQSWPSQASCPHGWPPWTRLGRRQPPWFLSDSEFRGLRTATLARLEIQGARPRVGSHRVACGPASPALPPMDCATGQGRTTSLGRGSLIF